MKSCFLEHVVSAELAREALRIELGGQEDPWLILAGPDDPIAYFSIDRTLDGEANVHICANISGRHYSDDSRVLETLARLQQIAGGTITDDL